MAKKETQKNELTGQLAVELRLIEPQHFRFPGAAKAFELGPGRNVIHEDEWTKLQATPWGAKLIDTGRLVRIGYVDATPESAAEQPEVPEVKNEEKA